jgi:multiple sugar transport system permease protein
MKLRRAHFSIVGGILSALTCLLTASGALAETSVQDQVVVSVFSLPSKRGSSPDQVADYRVLERFQELHPHIKLVSSTPLRIIGQSAQDATALMAIAGGTSPDIIYVNFRQSDTYISQGFLYPLDEYFEKMTEEELAERIPGPVMPVVYRDGPGGKHHWIMPTQQPTATVLMYRRDLFDAAGLDPDRPPRDWEELYQYAQKLADPSKGIYALGFYTGGGSAWSMYTYLCSAGAKAVEQTPDGEWRAAFDSDEAVLAFDFVDRLQKAQVSKNGRTGPLAYRGGDLGDKWSYGQIAMAYNYFGGSQLAGFNPQLVGIAPVPKGPTGKSSAEVNCQMMGIFAGQKDKRVRDAAWEYIAFLNSDEARRIYTEAMVEQGAGRMLSPKWLRKYGHADLAALAPPGLEEQFERVLREGTPEPYGRNCQYVYSFMAEPIDRIYFTDFTSVTEQQRRARIKELLVAAVEKTNEKMIGAVPPEVRRTRNIAAWIVAAVAVAAFGLLVRQVFLWMRAGKVTAGEKPSAYKTRLALALLAPALILILWWHYLPLLRGSLMAFQNFNVMGGSPWVGISNFADVLFDERFWMSLKNSLYYCTLWMAM